jgi:hypothetical protein
MISGSSFTVIVSGSFAIADLSDVGFVFGVFPVL